MLLFACPVSCLICSRGRPLDICCIVLVRSCHYPVFLPFLYCTCHPLYSSFWFLLYVQWSRSICGCLVSCNGYPSDFICFSECPYYPGRIAFKPSLFHQTPYFSFYVVYYFSIVVFFCNWFSFDVNCHVILFVSLVSYCQPYCYCLCLRSFTSSEVVPFTKY